MSKSTKNQQEQARREQALRASFEDPNNVKKREWVKKAFKNDIDQIAHFAAGLMDSARQDEKELEDLKTRLREIEIDAFRLSKTSKVTPRQKRIFAQITLETNPNEPIALAFMSALETSKSLQGSLNSKKRTNYIPNLEAKKFVKAQWALHREGYEGNKSAFTRDYVKRVLNEMGVKVTEKQMREVWLKDTPPASKQAG